MDDEKRTDRRSFLKLAGTGLLALCCGCYGINSKNLKQDCYAEERAGTRVRVMSYNIANARGDTPNFWECRSEEAIKNNLDNIILLALEEQVDVLCMNEVDYDSARTHNIDQAEYIARGLCYDHIIAETMFGLSSTLELGNAIVSRLPLKLKHNDHYGEGFGGRIHHCFKSFVDFDVELGDSRSLNFCFTHLDHRTDDVRDEEADVLIGMIRKKTSPFVLLGDFNSGPGDPCFDKITGTGIVYNPHLGIFTYSAGRPHESIDHILVSKDLRIERYHASRIYSSDHLPIIGDIIL